MKLGNQTYLKSKLSLQDVSVEVKGLKIGDHSNIYMLTPLGWFESEASGTPIQTKFVVFKNNDNKTNNTVSPYNEMKSRASDIPHLKLL